MDCIYLFALSFTAANQSGIALVSASTQQDAFTILKNAGRYNGVPDAYTLVQATKLGVYTENRYELLFESYTNAIVAYDAIVNTIRHLVTREEFIEILGYTPADESDLYKKVDKEEGKGLSEENYTVEEKLKLANIDMSTVENIIETIKRNGVVLPVIDKSVNISVPTELSQLNTDATHRVVTDNEKAAWNDKYDKPSAGIPKSDLSDTVRESLNLADSAAEVIPNTASPENKLVDKEYVDSSISTASATFRGTSAQNLTELQFLAWANNLTHDLNDYVYWNTTDNNGNTVYKRYKFNGSTWIFEYDINNSSFSAAEWAAIQSGITDVLVTKLSNMPSVDTIDTKLARADDDHTRAETDHGIAVNDHTRAGEDHTRAGDDHQTASGDHTRAESDHSRAESDHTRAEEDHASIADKVSQEELAVAIEPLARKDGSYDTMSVGLAKNLEGRTNVTDSFFERTTGGDAEVANGLAQMTEVGGNSLIWNQYNDFSSSYPDGREIVVDNTEGTSTQYTWMYSYGAGIPNGHKIFERVVFESLEVSGRVVIYQNVHPLAIGGSGASTNIVLSSSQKDYAVIGAYAALTPQNASQAMFSISAGASLDCKVKYMQCIDLTAIFGSGNEPETVADFEAWLAENVGLRKYYPYTEGVVINNNMAGIETVGRNLLDPTTGKARIPGAYSDVYGNYYGITGTHGAITFTSDMGETSTITPDEDGKFLLEEPGELSVAEAGADCCVFLWWDGTQTDYVEHKDEKTYLDVTHIYGKLNGTGDLVRVWPTGMPKIGDLKDMLRIEDGQVVARRVFGEVDMGTLTWTKGAGPRLSANDSTHKYNSVSAMPLGIVVGYDPIENKYSFDNLNGVFTFTSSTFLFADSSYENGAAFKSAMSGRMLYFELATPQVYTDLVYQGSDYFDDGTPVTLPLNYNVDNWGIERVLPINSSEALATAKPELTCKYSIDAVETMNTHADEIEDLYEKNAELDARKPEKYGEYPDMVVGSAKNIDGDISTSAEFKFRKTGGDTAIASGIAKLTAVYGKSLVWNQCAKGFQDPWSKNSTVTASYSEGVATLTSSSTGVYSIYSSGLVSAAPNHKYLFSYWMKASESARGGYGFAGKYKAVAWNITTDWAKYTDIDTGVNTTNNLVVYGEWQDTETTFYVKQVNVFDLTLMFGAGNEPTTVAEFEAVFPLSYYDPSAGEIISNKTQAVEVTGRNQWDEEWELGLISGTTGLPVADNGYIRAKNFCRCTPNTDYYLRISTGNQLRVYWYDQNYSFISAPNATYNSSLTSPSNCFYFKLVVWNASYGNQYKNDICINISDPSFNGQYEPYKKNTIELNLPTLTGKLNGEGESVVIAPDGLCSAGTVYDEGIVENGYLTKIVKRIGKVDLGTPDWNYQGTYKYFYTSAIPNMPATSNLLSTKYTAGPVGASDAQNGNMQAYAGDGLRIKDLSYTAAVTFKTAMSGVMLYYELATPLTYILDTPLYVGYQEYAGGTEKILPEDTSELVMPNFPCKIAYPVNVIKTINELDQVYVQKVEYGKIGVVSQTQTWTGSASTGYNYTMNNIVHGLIPQSAIDLYESAGAVFNAATGYFEMNGLTDLSYDEIRLAYSAVYNNYGYWTNFTNNNIFVKIRTTFPLVNGCAPGGGIANFRRAISVHMYYWSTMGNMEVLRVTRDIDLAISLSGQSSYLFYSSPRLKEVQGVVGVYNCQTGLEGYFFYSPVLETIKLYELRASWKSNSPNLTLDSVVYAVTNSANGNTAITITLHATAYARCQADTTEYAYSGQTYTGIIAYATAKNITIQSA